MPRRLWLSPAMLATGAALLVAAEFAGATPERSGGIFKVGTIGASVQIDPQLSYITTAWWLEYATAAKLYNYRPGRQARARGRVGFTVSQGGRRYTFFHPQGLSVQRRHTGHGHAASRTRSTACRGPGLSPPGAQFIVDDAATRSAP